MEKAEKQSVLALLANPVQRMASYISSVTELDKLTPEEHLDKAPIHQAFPPHSMANLRVHPRV